MNSTIFLLNFLMIVMQEHFTVHIYGQKNWSDLSHKPILEFLLWKQIPGHTNICCSCWSDKILPALDNKIIIGKKFLVVTSRAWKKYLMLQINLQWTYIIETAKCTYAQKNPTSYLKMWVHIHIRVCDTHKWEYIIQVENTILTLLHLQISGRKNHWLMNCYENYWELWPRNLEMSESWSEGQSCDQTGGIWTTCAFGLV